MADGIYNDIGKAGAIPVAQILRTRADFPGRSLTYELQLSGVDWCRIGALASACDAAGLRLITLRCLANGQAFCALGDDGSADLGRLSANFDAAPALLHKSQEGFIL